MNREAIEIRIPGLLTVGRAALCWVLLDLVRFGYSIGWDVYLAGGK